MKAFLHLSNVLKILIKIEREKAKFIQYFEANVNAINAHVKNVRKFYKDDAKDHQQNY